MLGMADGSNTLFFVALGTYIAAMVGFFFRMAFTRADADGGLVATPAGRFAGRAATGLAVTGAAAHLASVVGRGLASGRVPWANMYEYSSVMALIAVVGGLVFVQHRWGHGLEAQPGEQQCGDHQQQQRGHGGSSTRRARSRPRSSGPRTSTRPSRRCARPAPR